MPCKNDILNFFEIIKMKVFKVKNSYVVTLIAKLESIFLSPFLNILHLTKSSCEYQCCQTGLFCPLAFHNHLYLYFTLQLHIDLPLINHINTMKFVIQNMIKFKAYK